MAKLVLAPVARKPHGASLWNARGECRDVRNKGYSHDVYENKGIENVGGLQNRVYSKGNCKPKADCFGRS
jgi:hypothetical protein